jgi:hypothetical protein
LREAAGNPTYRVLAKTAGFSATTLGDAAGGVRLPTLDVTLAYVGACGGDTEAWRIRWRELDRQSAAERGAVEAETEAGNSAEVVVDAEAATNVEVQDELPPPETDHGNDTAATQHPKRRRRARRSLLAAGVVIAAAGLIAWRLPAMESSAKPTPTLNTAMSAAVCPSFVHTTGTFPGVTYFPMTNVRTGARLGAPDRSIVPPKCTLEFTGYCLGDVVQDTYAGAPDMRWFELSGGGVVASAVIHGNPPASMRPSACPGDVSAPSAITLSIAPSSSGAGIIGLQASGTQVWIAGFAAYYPGAAGAAPQWQQVGMTDVATPAFTALLRTGLLGDAPGTAGIPVVAVACLGGNGPTDIASAGTIQPSDPTTIEPLHLGAADLTAAEQAACQYPRPD